MFNPFFLSGSTSDDLNQTIDERNLLPPCPDSPNCLRVTRSFQYGNDIVFKAAQSVIEHMGAEMIELLEEPLRVNAVFKVFIYKDDFNVLIEETENSYCRIHLRSASRVGHSDLGVNRRRVKQFLSKLGKTLSSES